MKSYLDAPDLPFILETYPWTEWTDPAVAYKGHSFPLQHVADSSWSFNLNVKPEILWPYISDTSDFNKKLELPEMQFEEVEGIMYGKAVYGGVLHEWEEVPWQWNAPHELKSARIYSSGFARLVRAVYVLQETETGTRMIVYFGWLAKNPLYKLLLSANMKSLGKKYAEVLQDIETTITGLQERKFVPVHSEKAELKPQSRSILEAARNQWHQGGVRKSLQDKIIELITTLPQEELYRIRPLEWLDLAGSTKKELVKAMLHGASAGLFQISWDVICPHCRGVRREASSLFKLEERGYCDVCEIDFDATGTTSIEVTFRLNPEIRSIQQQFFCAAEPAKKPHILLQKALEANAVSKQRVVFPDGKLRARIQGRKDFQWFEVQPSGSERVEWNTDAKEDTETAVEMAPVATIELRNLQQKPAVFIIEKMEEDQKVLRPSDLFRLKEYRELFPAEKLPSDIRMDLGIQTVMFTDVVGSSAFYIDKGDAAAFRSVRQHFQEIYSVIEKSSGSIVKTVGDAAFIVFQSAAQGLEAAIRLRQHFAENEDLLPVRISIHEGPCLAVNLDTGIDYFGNTVNLCAKMQNYAGANEICASGSVLKSPNPDSANIHFEPLSPDAGWPWPDVKLFKVKGVFR